jgi:hypothetical protein
MLREHVVKGHVALSAKVPRFATSGISLASLRDLVAG